MNSRIQSKYWFGIFVTLFFIRSSFAIEDDQRLKDIQDSLKEFDRNPAAFMERMPEKALNMSADRPSSYALINQEMDRLSAMRSKTKGTAFSILSGFESDQKDQPEDLVDVLKLRTLEEMESSSLMQSRFWISIPGPAPIGLSPVGA